MKPVTRMKPVICRYYFFYKDASNYRRFSIITNADGEITTMWESAGEGERK